MTSLALTCRIPFMADKFDQDTIGGRIAYARVVLGREAFTQSSLATAIGVSPQTIQQIESGETRRSKHLAAIARELHVSLEWIETGTGEPITVPKTRHTTDRALLTSIIEVVIDQSTQKNMQLSPAEIADISADIYDRLESDLSCKKMLTSQLANVLQITTSLILDRQRKPA